jgi:integrase
MVSRVRVPPKQRPKPFSLEEIEKIIRAFRTDRYYSHYADYVEFLFRTGCRTAEFIGLRWKHLNEQWIEAFAQDAMLIKRPLMVKDGTAVLVGFRTKEDDLVKMFCLES